MYLTRADILGADDRPTKDVEVPEWGGTVKVRALSGAERDAWEASIVQLGPGGSQRVDLENMRARLVALSCVDEEGNRIFTEEDAVLLGQKSAAALERVWVEAQSLSGLTDADIEELAEGFAAGPSGASTSG